MAITPVHIKYDACPDCRAPFREFGRKATEWDSTGEIRRHVNGGIWEYIIFTCGRRDAFIPNFERIETERHCQNTAEAREHKRKQELAKKELKTYISGLKVDDDFREDLQRRLGV